ncbi:calcium and integrin-binding protein 1-like [Crassostrea virginica]
MGLSASVEIPFTKDELALYRKLTIFTKNEIRVVYRKFQSLGTEEEPVTKDSQLSRETLYKLKELNVNPFKDRIVTVFSSKKDETLSFEDFLDMMSVFNEKASKELKAEYAFRMYDFDDDGFIGSEDIKEIINRLTGKEKLQETDIELLIENIFDESDVDDDSKISYPEFENIVVDCPEMITRFRFRL